MEDDKSMSKDTEISALGTILDPITSQTFILKYFGKRPLFIRGCPTKFAFLMTPDAFIHGLDRAYEIRCVFGGLKQATIVPGDIKEMYEAGATICITGVERTHEWLQRISKQIENEIGFLGRVDFRAYLSPPGSGFDFHYDARVATSLQIDGSKTWWYSTEPEVAHPTVNSPRGDMHSVRRAVSKHKIKKVTLRPGDLLCLPAGVWHKAEAGRGGSLALNMAFNHSGATILDVALSQLRERMSGDKQCGHPFLMGVRDNHLDTIHSQWESCIDSLRTELEKMSSKASAVNAGHEIMARKNRDD
jgi:ribosomal protein L16 Arg81 hydroxylase